MANNFFSKRYIYFKRRLRRIFFVLVLIFIVAAGFGAAVSIFHPEQAFAVYDAIRANFESRGFFAASGNFELFLLIYLNNITAAGFSVISGVVPFLLLPVLPVIFNGFILGVIEGISVAGKAGLFESFLALAPHGIFELPAFFYSAALGLNLCLAITGKLLFKNTDAGIRLALVETVLAFLFVVIPLLFVAALIEAYVTYAIVTR